MYVHIKHSKMKLRERQQARELRKKGYSMLEIAEVLHVAKSSISNWVRDLDLSQDFKNRLAEKGHRFEVVQKRRLSRLNNEEIKRTATIDRASNEISSISKSELMFIGLALYWGEGRKGRRTVSVSNSDPLLIQTMMKFFREICNVPENKFRGHIHIHSHLDTEVAEKYWSNVSNIPRSQFFKTYRKPSIGSFGKMRQLDKLPHGTFDVYVNDTQLSLRIAGWLKGMRTAVLDTS